MWVARDKDNKLNLFITRPFYDADIEKYITHISAKSKFIELDISLFSELTWEDGPKEVFLNTGYDMADQINHVWAMLKCTQDELNKANEKAMYYATKYEAIKKIVNE